MHTQRIPSVRVLDELAYEAGREYDPAFGPEASELELVELGFGAQAIVEGPSEYELRRRSDRERRATARAFDYVPEWFDASDLFPTGFGFGEV